MIEVAPKSHVRNIQLFQEVGVFKSGNGGGELPIYIDPESRRHLESRKEIKIDAYGWSFMKYLTIPDAYLPYYGSSGSCSMC
ncbi:MAG: hypothetical protein ACTSRW_03340 [Candidatus Helarchaeota archaeon]